MDIFTKRVQIVPSCGSSGEEDGVVVAGKRQYSPCSRSYFLVDLHDSAAASSPVHSRKSVRMVYWFFSPFASVFFILCFFFFFFSALLVIFPPKQLQEGTPEPVCCLRANCMLISTSGLINYKMRAAEMESFCRGAE